MEILLVQLLTE